MNIVIKRIGVKGKILYLQSYDSVTLEAVWTEARTLALIIDLADEIHGSVPDYIGTDFGEFLIDILMLRLPGQICIEEY